MPVTHGAFVRALLFLLALLCIAPAHALDSGRFGNVYLGSEPLRLRLTLGDAAIVRLYDSRNRELAVRRASTADRMVDFGRQPPGYYVVRAGYSRLPLVVVVDPVLRAPGSSPLAVDNAMSQIAPAARFNDIAQLLQLLGLDWARERLSWSQHEPARGRYQWRSAADQAVTALSARGLQVAQVFHATPRWARSDWNFRRVPDDLRDIYNFSRALASRYPGRVQAWEVWNEPDLAFFDDAASEMAAFHKAAFLGFRAADPGARVLSPSIGLAPGGFAEHLLANGLGPYFDIWNYHSYGTSSQEYDEQTIYAPRAAAHRELLARHGLAHKPMWVTEAGLPAGITRLTSTARRSEQAAFLSRALPQALACGVERYFWFLFTYHSAANLDWGLFEPGGQRPLPALAALSTAGYALGQGRYRGKLAGLPAGVQGLVFDRGNGTETLALWQVRGEAQTVNLPLDWRQLQAAMDHLGSPLAQTAGPLALAAEGAAYYLILPAGLLDPYLTAQPAAPTTAPAGSDAPPVVLRLRLAGATLLRDRDIHLLRAGRRYALTLEAYNFGSETRRLQLEFQGAARRYLPQQRLELSVPAGGRQQQTLALALPAANAFPDGAFRVLATAPGGQRIEAVLHLELAR